MQAYSIDLRKRVIRFITEGSSQKLATEVFNLNKATVNRWWLRYKKEGHINPRPNLGSKSKVDRNELINYVESNPDARLYDIGLRFNVSDSSIHRHLKKLGFSYKKKRLPMWKQMRKSDLTTQN